MTIATRARLGGTGIEVTPLSFGASPLGNVFGEIPDDVAQDAVAAAWDVGMRYFDTAPFYGSGLSERRLGAGLAGRPRAEYVVSTKVGRLLTGPGEWVWDFTADGVRRSLEGSLGRLGLDRVEVVYLHDPDDHIEQAIAQAYPALVALRDEGVIGAVGVGVNQCSVATPFVEKCELDCLLLAGRYTLLDRQADPEFLQLCANRAVSLVIGGALNTGVLIDPDHPGALFDYAPVPEEIRARARELRTIAQTHGVPLTAAGLQFPARHPVVASVVVGCSSRAHVEANAADFEATVPDALWDGLG